MTARTPVSYSSSARKTAPRTRTPVSAQRIPAAKAAAAGDPGVAVALNVIEEASERGEAAGPAGEPHVEADRHHLRRGRALRVEHVEGVAQVREEVVAGVEALRHAELHVVVVERVGNDEVWLAGHDDPVREIVVVGVRVVQEPALLDDEATGVGTQPSGVPAERPAAGGFRQALDRQTDVLALLVLTDELVINEAPAVAHHLVARLDERRGRRAVALERHADGEHADLDIALGEEPQEPPEPHAGPVLVHRLHLHVAHALERLHADDFMEERLREVVTLEERGP